MTATPVIPDSSQLTPEPIPPTNLPTNGVTDKERELMDQVLREQNRRIQELELQVTESRKPVADAPRNVEAERQRFYEDPRGANQELIREELQRSLAPFQSFIARQERDDSISLFINRAKSDPRFASRWDDSIERYVQANISSLNPLNEQSFMVLVVNAFGLQNLGMLPGQTSTPPNAQPRNTTVTPPSIPPTRSSPDVGQPPIVDQTAGLSEMELRLARERKQTPAEYKYWRDLPAADVAKGKYVAPGTK